MADTAPKKTLIDQDAKAIRKLSWVASVRKLSEHIYFPGEHPGYQIETKKDALTVLVTHSVVVQEQHGGDEEVTVGPELKKPFRVPLFEFVIDMRRSIDYSRVAVAKDPKLKYKRFLPYPAWDGYYKQSSDWKNGNRPCMGDYYLDYHRCSTWLDRAELLGFYLQTAKPHRSQNWYSARYAYWAGLMPEEHIKRIPAPPVPEATVQNDGEPPTIGTWTQVVNYY